MDARTPTRSGAGMRLVAAVGISVGAVLAVLVVPSGALSSAEAPTPDGYKKSYGAVAAQGSGAQGSGTVYLADGTHVHADGGDDSHNHNDPRTKNSVSRTAQVTDAETADTTTPAQARAAVGAAAQQRAQSDPRLSSVPVTAAHSSTPSSIYNMFNACYGVQSTRTGKWLSGATTNLTNPVFAAKTIGAGVPLYFKPTTLGRYLLYSPTKTYLGGLTTTPRYAATPGATRTWLAARPKAGLFKLGVSGRGWLTDSAGKAKLTSAGTKLRLKLRSGCTAFPEVGTNVTGNPFSGVSSIQEVRGFIDAHTHGMAFEFLGGQVHCGRPWSPYGVETALKDCPDHTLTGGKGALVEAALSNSLSHDPVGWPTFKDWPAPESLTHEGTYYKWLERAWRGGQRILVNLLVENNKLCEIYPLKRNSCNDMDSIRLQAKDMRELERYVDAQSGGPGKGWYRIVTTPDQARKVINAGKLAVVMGIETSVPFDCTQKLGVADLRCTKASIDRQLDEVRKMGVSQMELVNKFDNALSGVAGDNGATGVLVNAANLLETGSSWRMQTCAPNDAEVHDRDQDASVPLDTSNLPQDALFGAVAKVAGITLPSLPLYPAKHHCNTLGLSPLGEHVIRGLAKRNMMFDPDHMSVKARKAALDIVESMKYSGVLSSHSWSTPDAYSRIYADKGFITPYAGDSNGFVEKWKRHQTWANPKTYWGFGFGADINGLGAQGDPRPDAATNHPVTYPFTTLGGVKIGKQVSGKRVYDINKDGVAHYGLYPDWIQDLKMQAGQDIVKDMSRGPEAYLQMWERAYGIRSNACTDASTRLSRATIGARVKPGMTSWATLKAIGQPSRRLNRTFSYCSTGGAVHVQFTAAGKVSRVVQG